MTFETTGEVVGGKLKVRDRQQFETAFASWADGPVLIRIDRANVFRSEAQNRLWHAAIVVPLAAHCGVTPRQMHEALKVHLLPEVVRIPGRDGATLATITIGGSTTQLTRREAANLIDRAILVGRTLGLELDAPRAEVSHYIPFDAPPIGKRVRALCGELVNPSHHHYEPTCDACAAALRDDTRQVADLS
jgi:hypothetical protein